MSISFKIYVHIFVAIPVDGIRPDYRFKIPLPASLRIKRGGNCGNGGKGLKGPPGSEELP
jgi:hypothetical protein